MQRLTQIAPADHGDERLDGVLTVSAQENRSQLANRRAAQQRLVDALADALAPPPRARRTSRPSRRAVQRRLDAKRMRSRTKALRRRPPD